MHAQLENLYRTSGTRLASFVLVAQALEQVPGKQRRDEVRRRLVDTGVLQVSSAGVGSLGLSAHARWTAMADTDGSDWLSASEGPPDPAWLQKATATQLRQMAQVGAASSLDSERAFRYAAAAVTGRRVSAEEVLERLDDSVDLLDAARVLLAVEHPLSVSEAVTVVHGALLE